MLAFFRFKTLKISVLTGLCSTLLLSCVGHDEKLKEDMFNLQTRLLLIERNTAQKGKEVVDMGDATNKRMAVATNKLEDMENDLAKLKGDIAVVTEAVKVGKFPQQTEDEPSLAKSLKDIIARLEALEKAQAEMLHLMEEKSKKPEPKAKSAAVLKDLNGVKTAFKQKKFTLISEEAPKLFEGSKKKEADEIRFYYAESLFKLAKMQDAAIIYDQLVKKPSLHDKHPQMQLRLGDCFKSLGEKDAAKVYYKELIEKYPSSAETKKAKENLKAL